MWSSSYSTTVKGLSASDVWKVWTDVNHWHAWQDDIEYARLDGEFRTGTMFRFKPKGGPNINIEVTEVIPNEIFVDLTKFPLARMYDSHELIERGDQLEIRSTIRIEGPLSFLWRKLVVEGIAAGMKEQTDKLIARVQHG